MSLRILSVGAHDGFIERWVLDHLDAHVDALELNSQAAARCEERITGTCKIGAAEDAPELFEPGSYDAVVAYELIEHVPDVPAFLDAIEAMVHDRGRVYLSTPDGTFGEGSNPHHLRAYRAIDLVDLARRRGRLHDAEVGSDGITSVSYTPCERFGDIAIYTGAGWERWAPHDIERRGLGGSETAAVRLAHELSELGWIVTVYGSVEPCAYRDVVYRSWRTFDPLAPRDAVIASRIPELGDRPIVANTTMLWTHDTDFGTRLTPRRAERFDHILTLSRWHEQHVRATYPFAAAKVIRTRNGIHLPYFKPKPWAERAPRVLYTSSPDRGLDVLLELWPEVRKQVPEAELHHCYAEVYDRIADQDPKIAAHRERIHELTERTEGVRRLGALPQPELARLMCESRVWAHPSYCTPYESVFNETSCIGAMEAQAAGCWVVGSDWGALTETIKVGARVNGGALSKRWRRAFVDEIVRGLTDAKTGAYAVTEGPRAAQGLGWDGVAREIASIVKAGWPR